MKLMKRLHVIAALLILISLSCSCSRKAAPPDPAPPEVLVTTVTPQDVPRILERVATLDGFIKAIPFFRSTLARLKPHWRKPRALWQKTKLIK
jgi:hypothetical protein